MYKKKIIPIFLICFIGLLFGASSNENNADEASGNNSIGKASSDVSINAFQHICDSMNDNFQPCIDIQDENEEELVEKIRTCSRDAFQVLMEIEIDENAFKTELEKKVADLQYQSVLLSYELCVESIPFYEDQRPKNEFSMRCISDFISDIQSKFCSK